MTWQKIDLQICRRMAQRRIDSKTHVKVHGEDDGDDVIA